MELRHPQFHFIPRREFAIEIPEDPKQRAAEALKK
jgi:hypothetical protein